MRGKLRDKRDARRDRLKREMMGRRPTRRDNRNVYLLQREDDENDDDYLLAEEGGERSAASDPRAEIEEDQKNQGPGLYRCDPLRPGAKADL